jgi:5-methylthioribose kinase
MSLADLADRTVFVQLRVSPFYERVRERRPEVAGQVTLLIEELMTRRDALCHGDFSPKNILVHRSGTGAFTLVDYETAHLGDPTMDLGFFLSHLVLKAIKNHERRVEYFALTTAFWDAYTAVVRFLPISELVARGIQHFAVCALARIDGISPVDYLPEQLKREVVRTVARRVLLERPGQWNNVLEIVESACSSLPHQERTP